MHTLSKLSNYVPLYNYIDIQMYAHKYIQTCKPLGRMHKSEYLVVVVWFVVQHQSLFVHIKVTIKKAFATSTTLSREKQFVILCLLQVS